MLNIDCDVEAMLGPVLGSGPPAQDPVLSALMGRPAALESLLLTRPSSSLQNFNTEEAA